MFITYDDSKKFAQVYIWSNQTATVYYGTLTKNGFGQSVQYKIFQTVNVSELDAFLQTHAPGVQFEVIHN